MIRSGGFRIPGIGEMEGTDIDEIIRRYKPVSSTKTKTPKKTKPVAKAKAKTKNPRVKTKRKSPVGRRINMRGNRFGLIEDIELPPVQKKKAVAVKPKPKPKPRPTSRPTKVVSKPQFKPKVTPRPSSVKVPSKALPTSPQSREEILKSIAGMLGGSGSSGPIRSGIFKDAIYPGDSGYEEALAESKLSDSGGGGLFGGGRRLTPEIIQMIKEAQEARRATGGGGLFGLIGGGQRTPAPSFQNPFLGQMQMQQPINPIVGFQDESQPKFPDIPQFMQKAAGETFGGYGGLSSIKPIMEYAGMGDSPSAPPTMNKKRPLPRPPYNPDAQPGGPSMPRDILRRLFT